MKAVEELDCWWPSVALHKILRSTKRGTFPGRGIAHQWNTQHNFVEAMYETTKSILNIQDPYQTSQHHVTEDLYDPMDGHTLGEVDLARSLDGRAMVNGELVLAMRPIGSRVALIAGGRQYCVDRGLLAGHGRGRQHDRRDQD
jgi:hypothetical protein